MLPGPEIWDCYLKNIFPNLLSKIFSDFISDMGVTDHKHLVQKYKIAIWKTFFLICCQILFRILFQIWE